MFTVTFRPVEASRPPQAPPLPSHLQTIANGNPAFEIKIHGVLAYYDERIGTPSTIRTELVRQTTFLPREEYIAIRQWMETHGKIVHVDPGWR